MKVLPDPTKRPAKTRFLVRFEESISSLNDFYWGTRVGFEALTELAKRGDGALEALPKDVYERWQVKSANVSVRLESAGVTLRQVVLVKAVASYEDYLKEILEAVVARQPLPPKKPRLQVDLGAVPSKMAHEFAVDLWVSHKTQDVLGENPSDRPRAVEKALGIENTINSTVPPLGLDRDSIRAAGVIRNCIVHAGGKADRRAVEWIPPVLAGLSEGAPIPLDERLLWKLVGALGDHVEAIDLLVRLTYSDLGDGP